MDARRAEALNVRPQQAQMPALPSSCTTSERSGPLRCSHLPTMAARSGIAYQPNRNVDDACRNRPDAKPVDQAPRLHGSVSGLSNLMPLSSRFLGKGPRVRETQAFRGWSRCKWVLVMIQCIIGSPGLGKGKGKTSFVRKAAATGLSI